MVCNKVAFGETRESICGVVFHSVARKGYRRWRSPKDDSPVSLIRPPADLCLYVSAQDLTIRRVITGHNYQLMCHQIHDVFPWFASSTLQWGPQEFESPVGRDCMIVLQIRQLRATLRISYYIKAASAIDNSFIRLADGFASTSPSGFLRFSPLSDSRVIDTCSLIFW
jgi:hypothetical protein